MNGMSVCVIPVTALNKNLPGTLLFAVFGKMVVFIAHFLDSRRTCGVVLEVFHSLFYVVVIGTTSLCCNLFALLPSLVLSFRLSMFRELICVDRFRTYLMIKFLMIALYGVQVRGSFADMYS